MTEYRFFRSATHPEFLQQVIEPLLVEREMDTRFASAVAGLMDVWGWSPEQAVAAVRSAML